MMPEDPTPAPEPTPHPQEAAWTDDVDPSEFESASPVPIEQETSTDNWEDHLDWEDDPVEPPKSQPTPVSTRDAIAWLKPIWRRGLVSWRRVLVGIRSRIPAATKLSDSILSGILIGGLLLLIAVLNLVRQPAVADMPAEPSPFPSAATESSSAADESPTATEVLDQTPALEPDSAERDRIAEIETKLTDGSLSYGNGLVESVQADFKHNNLTIDLSSGWYRLSAHEQEELANNFRQRSLQMTFDELELRSSDGDLLARSPVVGKEMVILQREKPPEVELPSRPRYRITVDR